MSFIPLLFCFNFFPTFWCVVQPLLPFTILIFRFGCH
ncbi:hypothetical protein V6Z11_D07G206900 [Gossypium hirsutum]